MKGKAKNPLPQTISEYLYDSLRDDILSYKLKPNQVVNEVKVAEEYSVSRTPVREAVRRLAAEGFIEIDSRKKAKIKPFSYDEMKELFQVLGMLDSSSIGMIIKNLKDTDIAKLERFTSKMSNLDVINDPEKFLTLNMDFHSVLWETIPNKALRDIYRSARDKLVRCSFVRFYSFFKHSQIEESVRLKQAQKSINHHQALVAAIKRKDIRKLKKMMIEHWNLSFDPPEYDKMKKDFFNDQS